MVVTLKRFGLISGIVVLMTGGALGIGAARHESVIAPGTMIGPVPVGGLTIEQAQKRLRLWWDTERLNTINLSGPKLPGLPSNAKWAELGLKIDDIASVSQIPLEGFWDAAGRTVGIASEPPKYEIVWAHDAARYNKFDTIIRSAAKGKKPARVEWNGKSVVRTFEITPMVLSLEAMPESVLNAYREKQAEFSLPTINGEKDVPDEALNRITDLVSTFTTKFPSSNVPRSENIRLASSIIDGHVLMPGAVFSFNSFLGARTTAKGYKVAGVYANGRHDVGVGGGICQVSTTLYNAVVFGGLKIDKRQNHSMSVAYVPVGRDAAVSYPSLDLVFTNRFDFPIAIDAMYSKGKLTFNILGVKDKGLTISVERGPLQSWSRGVKYEHDPSLPYGKTRLIDSGGTAHKVTTYRVFKRDGKVEKREVLAVSQYPGSPRLYGRNMKARPPAAPVPSSPIGPAPVQSPNPDY